MTTPTSGATVTRTSPSAPTAAPVSGSSGSSGASGAPAPGAPAATTPAPPPSAPTSRFGLMVAAGRAYLEKTPGRMQALAALGVLVALAFGLAAGQAFRAADDALLRASSNTEQLVRIQEIQTNLVKADATATNAFLLGGLEPVAQRAAYEAAVSSASRLMTEAAQHQPADGHALSALNDAFVAYASEIERARADNRLALPVGAQYLKDASAHLRSDALPILKNLVDANDQRVVAEFDNARRAVLWLVLVGILAIGVLVLELVWLARRTRRYLNMPLATGALVVTATLVVGMVGLAVVASTVDSVRDGAYAATLSTAKARIAGFDAKSNESLTLIARGSGQPFEKKWQASDKQVRAELDELSSNPASADLAALPWPPYKEVHQKIRALDDSGQWDEAVALATGNKPTDGNGSFAAFDSSSAQQLSSLSSQTVSRLDGASGWLPFAGVLGLLAGLAAAGLAWFGFSQRLEEYR